MPKIDTLDALGDAITKILATILTTDHAKDMPNKCPRYAIDMPGFVPKLVRKNGCSWALEKKRDGLCG